MRARAYAALGGSRLAIVDLTANADLSPPAS